MVQWYRKGAGDMSLAEWLESPEIVKRYAITGGIQGWTGTLFGIPYAAGSWQDKLLEAFAGPHDYMMDIAGMYDDKGNAVRGRDESTNKAYDYWALTGAFVSSAPFALADLFPQDVWDSISIILKNSK